MSGSRRIFATADCNLATIVGGTPAQDCSPRTVATSKTLVAELVAGRHVGQRFVTLQDADSVAREFGRLVEAAFESRYVLELRNLRGDKSEHHRFMLRHEA